MVLVHMFGLIIWVNIACLETDMKVSGLIVDAKEQEHFTITMKQNMMDDGKIIKEMDLEF